MDSLSSNVESFPFSQKLVEVRAVLHKPPENRLYVIVVVVLASTFKAPLKCRDRI